MSRNADSLFVSSISVMSDQLNGTVFSVNRVRSQYIS